MTVGTLTLQKEPIAFVKFSTFSTFPGTKGLKLVRTPLNVYFTAFKSSFLSLYAHINSDECHAWFHLNAACPAVRNAEQVNITKNSYLR